MDQALCINTNLQGFINPTDNDSPRNRAAIEVCKNCPVIKECAKLALTAGTTLKPGLSGPAQGVIQAGIVCRGDLSTAFLLAKIAETDIPDYGALENTRRGSAPPECHHCEKPMTKWTRNHEEIPEGYVMHYARGFCVQCRAAYRAYRAESNKNKPTLSKEINRNQPAAPRPPKPAINDQLQLFNL